MNSKYKKEIYQAPFIWEDEDDPFHASVLWKLLEEYGAVYKGKAEDGRGSYVYSLPDGNVYLICIVYIEPEFQHQVVYIEGDSMEIVNSEELKLKSYLINCTTKKENG